MQPNQYTSRQNVGIIDPLSYMTSYARGSSIDLVPSLSLVTCPEPLNSDLLALRYGANVGSAHNLQAQRNSFFPRLDTSTSILPRGRLQLETDLYPSLSTTGIGYLSNSDQLLRQHEYNALLRGMSVGTHSSGLETEYSSYEKRDFSPSTNAAASHIEESDSFFSRKTDSPSFKAKASGSRKRYHSPSSSHENSPMEKREYRRKTDCSSHESRSLRNEERHRSPVHSNESPPREIRGYRFSSMKENDISSHEKKYSRSREQRRSPVHSNKSPLGGKRDHRSSSTGKTDIPLRETKSSRSREKHRSRVRGDRGVRTEKRDHDDGTDADKPRESRFNIVDRSLAKIEKLEHKNTSSKTGDEKKKNDETSRYEIVIEMIHIVHSVNRKVICSINW